MMALQATPTKQKVHRALLAKSYKADGFVKVCDVSHSAAQSAKMFAELFDFVKDYEYTSDEWRYTNINQDIMFSEHTSWVYFIVVAGVIYKIGETGNPLGIKVKTGSRIGQPKKSTECRFGRLSFMKDPTDGAIRAALFNAVKAGTVTLWAKKCEAVKSKIIFDGEDHIIHAQVHKQLEKKYLDLIVAATYMLPDGNKGRC